jgi:hypothetical protein
MEPESHRLPAPHEGSAGPAVAVEPDLAAEPKAHGLASPHEQSVAGAVVAKPAATMEPESHRLPSPHVGSAKLAVAVEPDLAAEPKAHGLASPDWHSLTLRSWASGGAEAAAAVPEYSQTGSEERLLAVARSSQAAGHSRRFPQKRVAAHSPLSFR